MLRLKRVWFACYPFVSIAGMVTVFTFLVNSWIDKSTGVTLIGAFISIAFFTQKQKLEELAEFRKLFESFNKRYDALEQQLSAVLLQPKNKVLSRSERECIIRYFNLCAEEYLYYKKGLIFKEVWVAWRAGMDQYKTSKAIEDIWNEEPQRPSYYGFEF